MSVLTDAISVAPVQGRDEHIVPHWAVNYKLQHSHPPKYTVLCTEITCEKLIWYNIIQHNASLDNTMTLGRIREVVI